LQARKRAAKIVVYEKELKIIIIIKFRKYYKLKLCRKLNH